MRPQMGPTTQSKKWAHLVGAHLHLRAFPIDFFFAWCSIFIKNDVQEDWFRLMLGRSMRLKNTQKQGFIFYKVKTKIKEIV
jgi:hypothetical protein